MSYLKIVTLIENEVVKRYINVLIKSLELLGEKEFFLT